VLAQKEHIIFDLFGTLVHYSPSTDGKSFFKSYGLVVQNGFLGSYEDFILAWKANFSVLKSENDANYTEFLMNSVIARFFSKHCTSHEVGIAEFMDCYLAEWNAGVTYIDGLAGFLQDLAKKFSISLISNTHHTPLVLKHLSDIGITELFAEISTSADFGLRKPHPAIFRSMLTKLSCSPEKALYVGDNYEDDYCGATLAGIDCILISPSMQNVPFSINHLFELGNLLS
jgi:putative hydrolase of the HAD superfamily